MADDEIRGKAASSGAIGVGLPFVVAVSGHRDIHSDDAAVVQDQVYAVLRLVAAALPHTPIICLSPLADGADQLFAAQALRLARATQDRVRLEVPLPMALEDYIADQGGADNAERMAFAARMAPGLAAAGGAYQIPNEIALDSAIGIDTATAQTRDAPYLRLANYLTRRSQLMIAIWDGQVSPAAQFPRRPGGTLDTILARLERRAGLVVHVYARRQAASSRTLPEARTLERGYAALTMARRDAAGGAHVGYLRDRTSWPCSLRWRQVLARAEAAMGCLDKYQRAILRQIWQSGRDIERLNAKHRRSMAKSGAAGLRYRERGRVHGLR